MLPSAVHESVETVAILSNAAIESANTAVIEESEDRESAQWASSLPGSVLWPTG